MARSTSVTLDDQLQKFVDEQVASGRFDSASDVMSEGLRRFEAEERQLARLREQIAEGEAAFRAGDVYEESDEFWDDINHEVDARLSKGERAGADVSS